MAIADVTSQLERQSELLDEFGRKEAELQEAIIERDWLAMDAVIPELERLGDELEGLEREREALVAASKAEHGLSPESAFPELLSRVDPAERGELAMRYRDLQVAVLRVKNQTSGIDAYVRNSVRTANTVLGEVFPERKGTMYSKSGAHRPAHGSAIVLDHEL
jgi:hypothetical protein